MKTIKQYFDKTGTEIREGMHIQIEDAGHPALVEPCGEDDLGIAATNPRFAAHYPETEAKFYPLSNFSRCDIHVVQVVAEAEAAEDLRDDRFLSNRTEEIDNATLDAICTLAHSGDDVDDVSMELVGEVNAFIEELLKEHGIATCYPYHENDVICYKTADRCKHCTRSAEAASGSEEEEDEMYLR